jgi:YD repeat-containing protein
VNSIQKTVIFVAAVMALVAVEGWAAETITYTYDSRGRLMKVVRTGSVNNNVQSEYKYDKADNRTSVNVISPNAPP